MNIFVESALVVAGIQFVFFVITWIGKTDKVTDFSYGLTFVTLGLYVVFNNPQAHQFQWIIAGLITLWGMRLGLYLLIRIRKIHTDKRLDQFRHFWGLVTFWSIQALTVWVVMLPSILILSRSFEVLHAAYFVVGAFVWLVGFVIEAVADHQKYVFKSNQANKGKWIATGLWRHSRHPNYFGEMTLWWGLYIISLPMQSQPWHYMVILGPIYITCLLIFVSGIPPLEKRYDQKHKNNKKYQEYKRSTSILIPWFVR